MELVSSPPPAWRRWREDWLELSLLLADLRGAVRCGDRATNRRATASMTTESGELQQPSWVACRVIGPQIGPGVPVRLAQAQRASSPAL